MWEALREAPHGRMPLRKLFMLCLAVLTAGLLYLIAAPTAHAADPATWQGSNLSYNGHAYTGPTKTSDSDQSGLPAGTTYYRYDDAANNKAYLIYFASGTDPPKATSATLATYDFSGNLLLNKTGESQITITPAGQADSQQTDDTNTGTTSCSIDGIGWLVCPATRFIAKAMDYIYGVISQFLEVQPLQTTQNNGLYKAWDIARNFANICFVIGFLIVIYGQLTGGMLSNYTIKKILPRVIVAAILVNLSYWICAVGIDVSNILGYSVQDLFVSIRNTIAGADWQPVSWESATEAILTGGTAAIAGGVGGLALLTATGGSVVALVYLLIPSLVGVILAALVAVIVLAMRQALITVLVIIAPLAFVAYLLPNTEKWFERWRQTFTTMLMLFPIFSVIFGGSQVAGTAIIQNASSPVVALLGMVVQVAPLVVTPLIVRFSGSLLGRIAGMVNNPNKGLLDRTRNLSKERADYHRNRSLGRDASWKRPLPLRKVAQRMEDGRKRREEQSKNYQEMAANRFHGGRAYHRIDQQRRELELDKRRIEAGHELHWRSRFDLQNAHFDQRLFEKETNVRLTTDRAKFAEERMNTAYQEMQAGGNPYHAIGIQGPPTQAFNQLMNDVSDTAEKISVEALKKASAEVAAKGRMAGRLKDDVALRTYAGGIDPTGATKVYAKATAEVTAQYMENVKAVNTIFSNEGYTPDELLNVIEQKRIRGNKMAEDMHVHAAIQQLLVGGKGNHWSAQKTLDFVGSQGMNLDSATGKFYDSATGLEITDQKEITRRRDLQQIFNDAVKQSPLKVGFLSGTDRSSLETGTYTTFSEQAILRDINTKKIDASRLVETDIDELQRMVQILRDPNNRNGLSTDARQAVITAINEAKTNPALKGRIKKREGDMMNVIAAYLDPTDTRTNRQKEDLSALEAPTYYDYTRLNDIPFGTGPL